MDLLLQSFWKTLLFSPHYDFRFWPKRIFKYEIMIKSTL